jgi:amidase
LTDTAARSGCIGRHRGEAELLQAGWLFEEAVGLSRLLPIDPKPGMVPPA